MQDRIANHPNRWVVTPVTGETDTYDFTRADDPTQVGTPLNKATFLPDAVASAIESATGVSGVTLPADALNALATALVNLGISTIGHIEAGSYKGTGTAGSGGTGTATSLTFNYYPRFVFIIKSNVPFNTGAGEAFIWVYSSAYAGNNTNYYNNVTLTGKTLSWITNSTTSTQSTRARDQMNTSNQTYYYISLGVE